MKAAKQARMGWRGGVRARAGGVFVPIHVYSACQLTLFFWTAPWSWSWCSCAELLPLCAGKWCHSIQRASASPFPSTGTVYNHPQPQSISAHFQAPATWYGTSSLFSPAPHLPSPPLTFKVKKIISFLETLSFSWFSCGSSHCVPPSISESLGHRKWVLTGKSHISISLIS